MVLLFKKDQLLFLIAVLLLLFFSGCTSISTNLGIAEAEWSNYTQQKQQELLNHYEKATEEYNKFKNSGVDEKIFLEIGIHGGQVMMSQFYSWQNYNQANFIIFKGQCRDIVLQNSTNENIQTELSVCFLENTLYLDRSHYDLTKKIGSISINYSPLWLSGFAYRGISSSGYVKLNNVTVEITQKCRGEDLNLHGVSSTSI